MIFSKKWIVAGFALTCLPILSWTYPVRSEQPSSEPLALVDNKPITAAEFQGQMARRHARIINQDQKEALLEEMIRIELLYAAALKAGYDKDPQIRASLKQFMANKYREDVLEPRFEKITVSEKEIENYYKKHQSDFITPIMVRTAIIRISVSTYASKQKKAQLLKRAEAARIEALNLSPATRSFGSVAVTYSDHQSTRYRGGDTGWLQVGRDDQYWPDEVMETIFSLKETGKVSPVITSPTGYYLVKLMGRRGGSALPLGALKERIRHQLLAQKKAEVECGFYKELKGNVPVWVDRARLQAIEPSEGRIGKEEKQPPGLPGR